MEKERVILYMLHGERLHNRIVDEMIVVESGMFSN